MADIAVIQSCNIVAQYYKVASKGRNGLGVWSTLLRAHTKTLKGRYPGIHDPQALFVLHWVDSFGALTVKEVCELFGGLVPNRRVHVVANSLVSTGRLTKDSTWPRTFTSNVDH